MRKAIAILGFIGMAAIACAQSGNVNPIEIRGHYIGEPIERFLHLEADAREEMDVCQQHPRASVCEQLAAAIELGHRTEISTSVTPDLDHPDAAKDTINFVLDGKKLVKLTMLVNDPSDVSTLGHPSSESEIPAHNASGKTWVNHLTVWEKPDVYATLYQDNNPSLEDRRPVLIVESREEHAREDADSAKTAKSIPTN